MLVRIFSLMIMILLAACGTVVPDYNPLNVRWAKHIAGRPGGHKAGSAEALTAEYKAKELEKRGYALYQRQQDTLAVREYEKALRLHASGRLYFRYANSLSNLKNRLQDAATAYGIAREMGYKKDGVLAYNTACVWSKLGDMKEAYNLLEQAVTEGYGAFSYMDRDMDLAGLRKDVSWPQKRRELVQLYEQKYLAPKTISQISNIGMSGNGERLIRVIASVKNVAIPKDARTHLFAALMSSGRPDSAMIVATNLLQKNDDYYYNPGDGFGGLCTPVIGFLESNRPDLAVILIKQGFMVTNSFYNDTSAMNIAAKKGYLDVLQACLDRGLSVDHPAYRFMTTPLMAAIRFTNMEAINYLLSKGADTAKESFGGANVLVHAVWSRHKKTIALIRKHEAEKKGLQENIVLKKQFEDLYMNRLLISKELNHSFLFLTGPNFSEYGLGDYWIRVIDMQRYQKEEKTMPFGFENGSFRIIGNQIELLNTFAYMRFSRAFTFQPDGERGVYLNGKYYIRATRKATRNESEVHNSLFRQY